MNFLDSYLYFISVPFIVIAAILLLTFRKAILTRTSEHTRRYISLTIGIYQVILYVVIFPMYVLQNRAYHTFLTDLCPFASLTFGITLIIGKERYIKMIMPWMLIGAVLTIFTSSPDMSKEGVFSGLDSYLRHISMFIVFFWALINLKTKYNKTDVFFVYLYGAVFIVWVILAAGVPYWVTGQDKYGVFSTGLIKPSWSEKTLAYKGGTETVGDYAFFADMGMPYPLTTIIFYTLSCGLVALIVFLTNYYLKLMSKPKRLTIKNQQKVKNVK